GIGRDHDIAFVFPVLVVVVDDHLAMEGERLDALDIPLMVPNNTESHKNAFTVSVDYLKGTTTGISAADRAATVRALVDDRTKPDE
ncbi:3,4-dihydroxy-2-butanone-4-phosphate synthase, partial [Rhizobium ruizarguesonis]